MIDLYLVSGRMRAKEKKMEKAMCTSCTKKAYKQTIRTLVALMLPIGFTQQDGVNLFVQKQ